MYELGLHQLSWQFVQKDRQEGPASAAAPAATATDYHHLPLASVQLSPRRPCHPSPQL